MVYPRWFAALYTWATFADFFVMIVVVAAWCLPKRFRPWYRAALLVSAAAYMPGSTFFVWLTWTAPLVVTAALILTCREPDAFREET